MRTSRVIAGLGAVVLASGGAYYYTHRGGKGKAGAESVRSVAAFEGPIEDVIEANGEVDPLNRVEIKPPIQGRIETLLVDEGDKVKAGQIIAWMSSTDRAAIIDAARAKGADELKKWQDAYKATPIVSPLNGVVILRGVVVGQTVDASVVLYALSDKLIVIAHVDEVDIGRIKMGMPGKITLDAYPDQSVDGKVFNILFEGKNVSNVITYGVKVEALKIPPFFRSQMTANIDFYVNRKDKALLVPAAAIRTNPNGDKEVLVPGPNGERVPRKVKLGVESGANVEIVSGLEEGEKILVVSKKYSAQQGSASSPLIFGNRPPASAGSGGGSGGGRGGGGGGRGQ